MNDGRVDGRPLIDEKALRQMRTIPFPRRTRWPAYGMGLWVGSYHLGGQDVRWLAHGGGGFGFRCQMKWLPDLGYGVVVLTNAQDHDNVNEGLAEDVLLRVVELLTGKKDLGPSDWLRRHTPSRTADQAYLPVELAGRYCGTNDDMTFLVKDGTFGYASGNAFLPITPISRYEYATKRYLYRFVCDAGGKPVSVVQAVRRDGVDPWIARERAERTRQERMERLRRQLRPEAIRARRKVLQRLREERLAPLSRETARTSASRSTRRASSSLPMAKRSICADPPPRSGTSGCTRARPPH